MLEYLIEMVPKAGLTIDIRSLNKFVLESALYSTEINLKYQYTGNIY
jgi:hypothetical protein